MQNDIVDIKRRQATSITEPVTLAIVKEWLIIDHNDDDALLTRLIPQVRAAIENKTKLSLVEREVVVTVRLHGEFKLPYGPVRSITSVVYSPDADPETLTTDDYKLNGQDQKVIRINKCGMSQITYSAGYGVVVSPEYNNPIPEDLMNGILQEIAYRYEHRGDETNTKSSAGNDTVNAIDGISSGAMQYIKPYIGMAWV
jgi:uncharacterized phiE125 gp8 family phage protein